MLQKPARPLPRRFNRPLTEGTRLFVEKRHKRIREHKRERSRRWIRRWRALIITKLFAVRRWAKYLVAGAAMLIVCLFLFSPVLHIREIRVVRTEGRVDLQKVLTALSPLYGKHLLFLSVHDVTVRVKEAVPDAVSVSVSKEYPSKVTVRISLSPLVARVRIQPSVDAKTGSGAVDAGSGTIAVPGAMDYMTDNGLLISTAHPSTMDPLPTIRIVDWGVRPGPGSVLLTPAFFETMRRAERALTVEFGQKIRLRTVYLRAREFHLDTATVSFWFDVRTPLEEQVRRLQTFLKAVKLDDVKNHIDLRLTGRVVYQ